MYAQTLQQGQGPAQAAAGGGGGIYEAAGGRQSAGHGAGAESIYGKKSDYYAPRPILQQSGAGCTSVPLSSSYLPPPPLPPSNSNKQPNQNQTQSPPQQRENNNKIYYAPRQPPQNAPPGAAGRYQTAPQPIPGAPSSHFSINQKIYMSPTNPFLSSTTLSPPQNQGIYGVTMMAGERQPPPQPASPRHAPPAVPQRSYLQQYHAQSQMDHSSSSPSHAPQHYGQTTGGNQIVPPQYLYQRPQPPGTKFVSSPIYNAAGPGGDGRGGVPINVAYHGGQSGNVTTSPPSSSLSSSHMISHNNPSKYTPPLVCSAA